MEWEYIQVQRDAMKFNVIAKQIRKDKVDFQKKREKEYAKLERLAIKLENGYRKLNKRIKLGKFTSISEVYMLGRKLLSDTWRETVSKKIDKNRKIALYIILGSITMIICLAIYAIVILITQLIKSIKIPNYGIPAFLRIKK